MLRCNHNTLGWKRWGKKAIWALITLMLLDWAHATEGFICEVSIQGVEDKSLRNLLVEVSDTIRLKDRPAASMGLLLRRVDRDELKFTKALRSQGFYQPRIETQITDDTDPVMITFRIDPGPPYLLKSVRIVADDRDNIPVKMLAPEGLGLVPGQTAKSRTIIEAKEKLLRRFKRSGYPFPGLRDLKAVVDHADQSMTVTFEIEAGPRARFGDTMISGLTTVENSFILDRIPWKEGEAFNVDLLETAESDISATGLFARVKAEGSDAVGPDGHLPIRITLKERKHRTIKAGASYKTDEGVGVNLSWEHRNYFSKGENLRMEGIASEIAYAAEGKFRKPGFFRTDQSLLAALRLAEDHPDAYTSQNINAELGIERSLTNDLKAGLGLALRLSATEQFEDKERFGLLSLPGRLAWDTSDALLNPARGGRLNIELAPFWDFTGESLGFVKTYASYSRYFPVTSDGNIVLAGRVAAGGIWGQSREAIPADLRFYAGGGGSIRGYAYQSVGPLKHGEPEGGRSLLEVSGEMRYKFTDTLGVVAFLDGGSAFAETTPDLSEDLYWGAGVGLRYFTRLGPIRLDLGVPLDRRKGIDDALQVYVSIGQAF